MHFIMFDLEFNQDFSSLQYFNTSKKSSYPFEIIQIGAIKLDEELKTLAVFNRYVKPTFYQKISSFITELTGITTKDLLKEEPFPEVFNAYCQFIGEGNIVFCVWGMADIKELFKNVSYHQLSDVFLPRQYINVQPYVSKYFNLPQKTLLRLEHAAKKLNIETPYPFHNAFHDAYYTAEIFKNIYQPSTVPLLYDPLHIPIGQVQRRRKRIVDFDKLIGQFEKMYDRTMTQEEQEMIKLAYKMGKTNQFLK